MRTLFLLIGLLFLGLSSFPQKKMTGIGAELSILSLKPSARWWVSKTTGFDVFAGVSAEFDDFKPNDYEAGAKYLTSFLYKRTERTYMGLMGKFKSLNVEATTDRVNLPVFGIFIGKEWYGKSTRKRAFAVEMGYQYGKKTYDVYNEITHIKTGNVDYSEFPFVMNIRYMFYKYK